MAGFGFRRLGGGEEVGQDVSSPDFLLLGQCGGCAFCLNEGPINLLNITPLSPVLLTSPSLCLSDLGGNSAPLYWPRAIRKGGAPVREGSSSWVCFLLESCVTHQACFSFPMAPREFSCLHNLQQGVNYFPFQNGSSEFKAPDIYFSK